MKANLRWKQGVKIIAWLVVVFAAGMLVYLRWERDPRSEVLAGKLGYTSRAGWINWNHANQDGVVHFLADLRRTWRSVGDKPFQISYAQEMSGVYGPIRVQSIAERYYHIDSCPDEASLEKIALGIFRETSEAFEDMQGAFPNAVDARSQESSFREGDLRGNLVAFYKALRGYPDEEVRVWLGTVSEETAVAQLKDHPIGKSHSWDWPVAFTDRRFDEIRHDPAWFARHAHLLRESRTCFRFSLP